MVWLEQLIADRWPGSVTGVVTIIPHDDGDDSGRVGTAQTKAVWYSGGRRIALLAGADRDEVE